MNPERCDCGKLAVALCSDVQPEGITLVRCQKPICQKDTWCSAHRHQSGTMGFPDWGKEPRTATWWGYDPDGPGLWEWFKAMLFTMTATKRRAAQRAWDDVRSGFAPQAPLPPFQVRVKKSLFRGNPDGTITEITEESK